MKKLRLDESPEFKAFWAIWQPISRHNDGRGLARDTFRKHVEAGAPAQDIVDGAQWFIRSMKQKDREFVPLSSTWINREAYLDMAEFERNYQRQTAERAERAANVVPMNGPKLGQTAFLRKWNAEQAEKKAAGSLL